MSDYNLGTARGKIILDADTSGADKANVALDGVGHSADVAGQKLDDATRRTQALQTGLRTIGTGFIVAGSAIVAGFTAAVLTAANFEQQMSGIQAVSGATAEQMDLISAAALRIGKATTFSASEAGQAMEELVKAGISVEDVLNGAADATVALAAAGGIDLPTAATLAANAMNQFNLAAKDLEAVTNTIAGAANASAIDMGQFAYSLSQVGAVANVAGVSFEDTATAIALLGNAGIVGSDAGTSLKTMLLNLIPTTDRQKNAMESLGLFTEATGSAFFDAAGNTKSLAEISELLTSSMKNLTKEQRLNTLEMIFGSDAIRASAILAEGGAAAFDTMAASMGKVTAADVAATRLDNMRGSIEQLKGSAETLAITIGTAMLPVLQGIVDKGVEILNWLNEVNPAFVTIGAVIGVATGLGLLFLGMAGRMAASLLFIRDALLLATGATALFGDASVVLAAKQKLAAAATAIWTAVLNVNPIVRIITVILALAAAIVALAGGWDEVANAFKPALDMMKTAFEPLIPVLAELAETVEGVFGSALEAIMPLLQVLIESVFPIIIQLIEALAPVIGAIAQILAGILGPVLKVVGALFEALAPILTVVLSALAPLIDLLMLVLGPALDFIVWLLEGLADILTVVADAITDFFKESSDGTSAATDAWGEFINFLTDAWTNIVAFFQPVIDAIVGYFTWLYDNVQRVWAGIMAFVQPVIQWFQTYVAPLIQAVIDLVVAGFNFLWNTIVNVWNGIMAAVGPVIEWFVTYVQPLIDGVVAFISAAFNYLWGVIQTVWQGIYDFISGIVNSVVSFITGVWGGLVGFVRPIFDAVYNAIKEPLDQVMGFFEDLYNNITGFFSDAGQWLVDAGKNIIGGLIKGIEDSLSGLTSLLNDITKNIPQQKGPPEKDKTLLFENGQLIMRGLAAGLQSEIGNVLGMLGGLNVSIPAALDASLTGQTNGGDTNKTVNWAYHAAPGSGQLSGEDEFRRAVKVSKVVVPGWAG